MANIQIVDGVINPWTIEGTDLANPNKIILFNLAIGQLAETGSEFGNTIKIQANILNNITGSVNVVQSRISEVTDLLKNWPDESVTLNIPSSAVNYVPPYQKELTTQDVTIINKLTSVPDAFKAIGAYFNVPSNSPFIYSFNLADGSVIQSVSKEILIGGVASSIPDLQPYHPLVGSPPEVDFSIIKVNYKNASYVVDSSSIKFFVIPKSAEEIAGYDTKLRLSGAWDKYSILLDDTQLLPLNSDPPPQTPGDKITLAIDPGSPDAFIFTRSTDPGTIGAGQKMFFDTAPSSIPKFVTETTNVEGVYYEKNGAGPKSYFYYQKIIIKSSSGSVEEKWIKVPGSIQGFTFKPSDPQKSDWIAQYSDKIVSLTQRSGDQTVFLNMLMYRYNYFFESATNLIKSFTSIFTQIANNF